MRDIQVSHKLDEIQLTKRISICDSLLKRNETDPFLKRIITGDEKWVVYDNVVRKRSWSKRDEPAQSTSEADIHQKKVMLSVWWNFKGIVYFELLLREPNYQFEYVLSPANEIGQRNQRTLADPCERTVIEYSDRSLTVL